MLDRRKSLSLRPFFVTLGPHHGVTVSSNIAPGACCLWSCAFLDYVSCLYKVLATGGLSYPHLGTDGRGHQVLTKLGHSLHPMYPALTPLKGWHPGQQQLAGWYTYPMVPPSSSGSDSDTQLSSNLPFPSLSPMLTPCPSRVPRATCLPPVLSLIILATGLFPRPQLDLLPICAHCPPVGCPPSSPLPGPSAPHIPAPAPAHPTLHTPLR